MEPRPKPIRLILVFGGQSAEREISCLTAAHLVRAASPERYEIHTIGIDKAGQLVRVAPVEISESPEGGDVRPLAPIGDPCSVSEILNTPTTATQTVVIPLLHGPLGEDGTFQGLLEMADVAYVGAGVLGSACAMDKAMAKTIIDAHGIPQAAWTSFFEHQAQTADMAAQAIEAVGLPCFVKPANMGSSIGVSKASTPGELEIALVEAFRYDEVVVVEEAIVGREIEFGVLGNHDVEVTVPGEITPGADFYDYNDKYFDGAAKLQIPADVDAESIATMETLARQAYSALRVEGMARADFLFEEGGRGPLINELNTIPGFTPISMYPKLWDASGVSYQQLIDRLVDLAIERHARRSMKRAAT